MQTKQQQIIYAPRISLVPRVQIKFLCQISGFSQVGKKRTGRDNGNLLTAGRSGPEKVYMVCGLRLKFVLKMNWHCILLAAYLELLLLHYYGLSQDDVETPAKTGGLSIITPVNPAERGCQLSIKFSAPMKSLSKELDKRGVVVSFRCSKIKQT